MANSQINQRYVEGIRKIDAEIRKLKDDIEQLEQSQLPSASWAIAYQQTRLNALKIQRQQFKRDHFQQLYSNPRRLTRDQLKELLGPVPLSSQNTDENFR